MNSLILEMSEHPQKISINKISRRNSSNSLWAVSEFSIPIENYINNTRIINNIYDASIYVYEKDKFGRLQIRYYSLNPTKNEQLTISEISEVLLSNITHVKYGYRYIFDGFRMVFIEDKGDVIL